MTARVDGQQWTAVDLSVAAFPGQSGSFTITGTESVNNASRSINLALYNVRGTGTYPLGVSSVIVGGRAQFSESGVVWATPNNGASGSVTLTTLTPTRIAGTFEYIAQLSSGSSATQSRSITNGVFDIPMQTASGSLPNVPDNAGSVVRATIGGNAYNAGTASATASNQGNGLGVNSHNLTYQLQISLAGVTTPGTYSLNQPAGRTISVTGVGGGTANPQCCWGLNALDVGTVTISSATASRIIGTFSATLRPQSISSQTQPLVISAGTFDVGR
ncbi:hypothetical protein BH23GEM9_BH23GEM9_29450 [soil metagenome]